MIHIHNIADYELGRKLGQGKNGRVLLARHKQNENEIVAIKIVKKNILSFNETNIHFGLDHVNIIKLLARIDNVNINDMGIVLEYAACDTLRHKLLRDDRIEEIYVSEYAKQIISAISYLHSLSIVHRDIKTENILLMTDNTIKLCDFEYAKKLSIGEKLNDRCGTVECTPPEMWTDPITPYDYSVDIWCFGINIYELLEGDTPFYSENETDIINSICNQPLKRAEHGSDSINELLFNLLQKNPSHRPDIDAIVKHQWLKL